MTLSPNIATSISIEVLFSFPLIILSFLFLVIFLSLCTYLFRNSFTFFSLRLPSNFGADSYCISERNFTSDFSCILICS